MALLMGNIICGLQNVLLPLFITENKTVLVMQSFRSFCISKERMNTRACFYCLFNGLLGFWRVETDTDHQVLNPEWSNQFLIK